MKPSYVLSVFALWSQAALAAPSPQPESALAIRSPVEEVCSA
jgi:hypothetical protein